MLFLSSSRCVRAGEAVEGIIVERFDAVVVENEGRQGRETAKAFAGTVVSMGEDVSSSCVRLVSPAKSPGTMLALL